MHKTIGSCLTLLVASVAWAQTPPEPPRLLPSAPAASVEKHLPQVSVKFKCQEQINVGMPLEGMLVVRNHGFQVAENVHVEHELPPGVRLLQTEPPADVTGGRVRWLLRNLAPASERELRLRLQIDEETELELPVTVTVTSSASVKASVTRPVLGVRQQTPENVLAGSPATIQIEVANTGKGPARRVVVRDRLPPGLHHPQGADVAMELGTLAPGEIRVVNLDVQAVSPGQFVNQVSVTAEGGLQVGDAANVRVGQAGLLLAQSGPLLRYLNTETLFQLEMTNPGDVPLKQVQLVDNLPREMVFAEASDGGRYDKTAHAVEWLFDVLLPGETKRISLKAVPTAPGEMTNRALAKAAPKLDARAESSINVVGVPALSVEVNDDVDPVGTGETTTLTIGVRNQGTSAHTRVQVLALVPEGWSIVGVEGSTSHRIIGRQLLFAPLAQLEPRAAALYKVQLRAEAPGDYKFKVQLQSDQLRLPVSAEESSKVFKD